jgi:hypothetical protein
MVGLPYNLEMRFWKKLVRWLTAPGLYTWPDSPFQRRVIW